MISEEVLKKINERGYWKVNIRPLDYTAQKIDSLSTLKDVINKCQVRFRGWPYPLVKEMFSGNDFIWGGVDWQNHIEYWRLYQSLQFLHYLALREDWEENVERFLGGKITNPRKKGSGLSIISSLYSITEIFEFISKYIQKVPFESGIKIKIDLKGTKDRKLFFYDLRRYLDREYICKIPEITYENTFSFEDFLSNSQKYAIDCSIYIFERFNWENVPREILNNEQKAFLGKKV
jgi:hypothetical protein